MKKATVITLIVSLCMVFAGLILCGGVVMMNGLDFDFGNTADYREKVSTFDEAFADVEVRGMSADVQFFVTTADECVVECTETDDAYYDVKVENNTLIVKYVDNRKWFDHIGFNFSSLSENVKVYLPENVYENVKIRSTSGNVTVNQGLACESLEAVSTSGSVRVYGASAEGKITVNSTSGRSVADAVKAQSLTVASTSGRVNVSNIDEVENVSVNATSGRIEATDIRCVNFSAEGVSGTVLCSGVIAEETLNAESTSGGVQVLMCDAEILNLKSTSGSIRGTLLSGKVFNADSVSGSVKVPASTQGGICNAKTTSGSIDIKIQ